MTVIDFSEVIKLKEAVQKEFGEKVHFHDACGGQYFTLETENPQMNKFIADFLKKMGYEVLFDKDQKSFTLSC